VRPQFCRLLLAAMVASFLLVSPAPAGPPVDGESTFTPDPATVTRHGPAWRYPQSGWHVVHIAGSPYERGFQHGKLLAAEIVDYIEALAAIRSHKAPHEAWKELRTLANALFLRRFDVEYLEEMKGIADGAASAGAEFDDRRLDLIDVVTLNSDFELAYLDPGLEATATGIDRTKFQHPQYSHPKARAQEHCSAFVATGPATADGRILAGHITMSDIEYVPFYNIWLDVEPASGRRIVMQTFPGGIFSGLDYYINSGGLILTETTIDQTKFNPQGKSLASRTRRAIQYADSIDRAAEILADESNGLYTNQWLLADIKTNEIAMFELGTDRSKMWRSSRNEWLGGIKGFYWGCNNSRDLEVLKETVPDLAGKPANLVRYPKVRDKAWLALFEKHSRKIGDAFAREAFSTSPLAAFPSCDAKFTNSNLAARLESWALFGPPLGRTWDPSPADRKKFPDVEHLVGNDWALLKIEPPVGTAAREAVDLEPFPQDDKEAGVKFDAVHPFAWRGTLLPKSDADVWLAAGFAEYEKVVSLEKALDRAARERTGESKPSRSAARDLVDLALFEHESKWLFAARRAGRDVPLGRTVADPAHNEWYDIAKGKGVMLLAALRKTLGAESFDKLMDDFGQSHAGKAVTTEEFSAHCEKAAGKPALDLLQAWLAPQAVPAPSASNLWTIYSFETEPEQALIIYGTLGDQAAQKEASSLLQRGLARRFHNFSVSIKSDREVEEADLKGRHLVLVGRPATNRIAARFSDNLSVSFSSGSFTVRGKTYAHPDSAIIAAGENPLNSRYSVVIYAGLGATSTWKCVQHIDPEELPQPQVLLLPAGRKPARFRLAGKPENVASP
jgi:hypothetical protein